MRFGLLLIDLQNDYLERPGLMPEAGTLIARVQRLLAGCRATGVPVFRAETRVRSDDSNRMPHWRRSQRRDCVEGTRGVATPQAIAAAPGEAVFVKPFFNAFDVAELETALARQGVDTLIVAGLYTHACVRDSVLAAYALGYRVWIARDAIASPEPQHATISLDFLAARAAEICPVDAILARLGDPALDVQPSTETWSHRNPCETNEIVFQVALADGPEVTAATARARAAQGGWDACGTGERLRVLRRWFHVLAGCRQELVNLLVTDVAKPLAEAEGEFDFALALLDHAMSDVRISEAAGSADVDYFSLGVVGLITPWNNPLAVPIGKLAPALVFGNAVVWKPALPGSRIAARILAALIEAGCDACQLVIGDADAGRRLAAEPGLSAVSFTGSCAAGNQLAEVCAALGRRFQGELGGNNPVLVLGDADPEAVARALAVSMFSFSGQRCTAPRRLLVEESIAPQFTDALRNAVLALKLGRPSAMDTQVGPLVSRSAQERMETLVSFAKAEGSRILCGGGIPQDFRHGCWFEPTVIVAPPPDSRLVTEEAFGPVVVLMVVSDLAQGIAHCNRVAQGLVATIYTNDVSAQRRFAAEVEAGLICFNQPRPAIDPAAPFVGWKASAIGMPEHGRWDRDFYTQTKAIYGGRR